MEISEIVSVLNNIKFTNREQWHKVGDCLYYRIANGVKFFYKKLYKKYRNRVGLRKPSVRFQNIGIEYNNVFVSCNFKYSNILEYSIEIAQKNVEKIDKWRNLKIF